MSLQAFLEEQGIENFSAVEVCPVGKVAMRGGKKATLKQAPSHLWGNIVPTLKVLEWLRDQVGPINILSGYRDEEYNTLIGGEEASLHLSFNACDITSKSKTPKQLYDLLLKHPDAKKLGLGKYKGFVHVDTRGRLGRKAPARW